MEDGKPGVVKALARALTDKTHILVAESLQFEQNLVEGMYNDEEQMASNYEEAGGKIYIRPFNPLSVCCMTLFARFGTILGGEKLKMRKNLNLFIYFFFLPTCLVDFWVFECETVYCEAGGEIYIRPFILLSVFHITLPSRS